MQGNFLSIISAGTMKQEESMLCEEIVLLSDSSPHIAKRHLSVLMAVQAIWQEHTSIFVRIATEPGGKPVQAAATSHSSVEFVSSGHPRSVQHRHGAGASVLKTGHFH